MAQRIVIPGRIWTAAAAKRCRNSPLQPDGFFGIFLSKGELFLSNLNFWPDYIIRRCFFLSGLFLFLALALLIRADINPELYLPLRHYIQQFQSFSILVLTVGLFGGLLLREGLEHRFF